MILRASALLAWATLAAEALATRSPAAAARFAVALVAGWAHALDLRGYVLACGRAQREGAS